MKTQKMIVLTVEFTKKTSFLSRHRGIYRRAPWPNESAIAIPLRIRRAAPLFGAISGVHRLKTRKDRTYPPLTFPRPFSLVKDGLARTLDSTPSPVADSKEMPAELHPPRYLRRGTSRWFHFPKRFHRNLQARCPLHVHALHP